MPKEDIEVEALVARIERGELRLPEMQRQYVWTATRVRDLLDSLYREYPSGSILVWDTDADVPERDMAVEQSSAPAYGRHLLLLDGQQRLTSLAAITKGEPVHLKNRVNPIEIAFNLDHPDGPPTEVSEIEDDALPLEAQEAEAADANGDDGEPSEGPSVQENIRNRTFVVASRAVLADPRWVKVSDIFNGAKSDWELVKGIVTGPDDPRFGRYTERLHRVRRIRKYQYVTHVLDRSMPYEEVAEIFVRVNSLGMKLRGSDLALAQITARWPGSLHLLEQFKEECEGSWFTFDIGLFIRAMVVFATGQSRFKSVGRVPVDRLQAAWGHAREGLRFAIDFLRHNAGVEHESLLSSPYFAIVIARFAMQREMGLSEREQRELLHWLFVASAFGRYSGSSETRLDADLAAIQRGDGAGALLDVVRQQFGRDRFSARDFEHRQQRSPLFGLVYLALRHRGAGDWGTGLRIAMSHQGRSHWIEHHLIFPRTVLTAARHGRAEVNEIANLAFISGGKSRMLGIKTPDVYFPAVVESRGERALRAHCIPTEPALWHVENYGAFLDERRRLLAAAVNAFLDEIASDGTPAIDPLALIAGGESDSVEFKETLRWNVRANQPDRELEAAVVKTVAGFWNTHGGTLLIGVNDAGMPVGLDRDVATLGRRANLDGFEQHLRQLLINAFDVNVAARVDVSFPAIEERPVCMVRVPAGSRPAYVGDGASQAFYVRTGNTTRPFSMAEAHEYIGRHFSV